MGEMADWTNDQMQEAYPGWCPVGPARDPKPPRCNRCGSTDVRWRQQGGRWVLFSLQPGKEHVCPVKDEFDALD